MSKNKPQISIDKELGAKIRELIRAIISSNECPSSDTVDESQIFFDNDLFGNDSEGYVHLTGKEAQELHQIIRIATNKLTTTSITSRKFFEDSLRSTILEVVDINNQREAISLDQRLDQALERLKNKFRQEPAEYVYYYPVHGLGSSGLPFRIGPAEFFVFQESTLDDLGFGKNQDTYQAVNGFKVDEYFGNTFTKVSVSAIDKEAAKEIAIHELRRILEILNFYMDFIPYAENSFLYLPGQAGRESALNMLTNIDESSTSIGRILEGSFSPVSFQSLLATNDEYNLGFEIVRKLISKEPNPFQYKLLNAMQWAGKAKKSEALYQNEQAFLFYAIALESIILIEGDKEELLYRLAIRLAHLLGKSGEYRPGIFKQIKDLYSTRSKIVHNGSFEVVKSDLDSIRFFVKNSIIRLLIEEPFASMKNTKELVTWFDLKIFE